MAGWPPKKNAVFVFYASLVSQADTKLLQANPTLAAGDVKVATDDAAPGNLATLPVVDADFTKRVKISLSAAEMNGDRISVIFSDAAGAEWADLFIDMPTSVRQIDDLAFLPKKNTALNDIPAVMVLSSNHVSPATGLTVIATRALDGATTFSATTGTVTEATDGVYHFDASAADMNGDIVTFKFSVATADDTFVTIRTGG